MNEKEAYLNKLVEDLKLKHHELKDKNIVATFNPTTPSAEEQVNQVADLLRAFEDTSS